MNDWNKLKKILCNTTNSDWDGYLDDLEADFKEIEKLWSGNVDLIKNPRLILIGEAPLYGVDKAYIYSPDWKQTSFLYESHFDDKALGKGNNSKDGLLRQMAKNGVVVIDALPYPLNEKTHDINYRNMKPSVYQNLLAEVFELYTDPKIQKILERNSDAKVAVRYARTYKAVGPVLKQNGFDEVHHLWGKGGFVNKHLFRLLLSQSQ